MIEVGSSWSAWTVPVLRWFCFQPHPFSPSNSDSLGIQPLTKHSQGNSQEDQPAGCTSPLCCCWAWCGHCGVLLEDREQLQRSFPTSCSQYLFLSCLAPEEGEDNFMNCTEFFHWEKKKRILPPRGKDRKKTSVSLSLCSFPAAVTVTEAQRNALLTELNVSEKYIFFPNSFAEDSFFFFFRKKIEKHWKIFHNLGKVLFTNILFTKGSTLPIKLVNFSYLMNK